MIFGRDDGSDRLLVKVPEQPNVLIVEGGAFVEATVWVPESALEGR